MIVNCVSFVVLDKPSQRVTCCLSKTKGATYWGKLPATGCIYTTNSPWLTSCIACCRRKCFRHEILPGSRRLWPGILDTVMLCM